MKTETQTLIILILGSYAIVSLIGLMFLVAFTNYDVNIILALVTVTTTPVSILGGFIAGEKIVNKTVNENQIDEYVQGMENSSDDYINEDEIL